MSSSPEPGRVAYVVKVYPRLSETFVVNELLAHERAGADLEVVSLRPPADGRLHPATGRVRAPIAYLPASGLRAEGLWDELRAAEREAPGAWEALRDAPTAREAHQAVLLARAVRERGIDHLHAHFANDAATVARMAAALAGVTYSLTAHAKDIFHEDVDPARLARDLTDAAVAVTVSDFNLAHLRWVAPAARLARVYNGLDLAAFGFAGPHGRSRRIVAVGRLVEKKGFADLVDACALLRDAGVAFGCDIVGGGVLAEALEAQVAERGLGDVVRLLGPRGQDEVRELVQGASVLAAPCVVGPDGNRDGLPTVLLEAMALGTPCVATDVTGIPEAVVHGRTGLVVGQHDPAGLADALRRLLDDDALRVRLATAARGLVEERFDADQSAAELRALWARSRRGALEAVA
jgi:glycosyltransferase involved in cell wall biosynthesis